MGIHVIKMPDIGEGIAEVELVEWHVKEGDAIAEDQLLADVMTDKATVEIPSPVAGKVMKLGGTVGQTLPVGSELIRIEVEGSGNVTESVEAPRQEMGSDSNKSARKTGDNGPHSRPEKEKERDPNVPTPRSLRATDTSAPANKDQPAPLEPARARAPGDKPIASPAVRRG